MLQARAATQFRWCPRLLFSLAIAGLWPVVLAAQTPGSAPKKGSTAGKKDAGKGAGTDEAGKAAPKEGEAARATPATPEEQEAAGVVDASKAKKQERVERIKDPRAEAVLNVDQFKSMRAVRAPSDREINDMASGQGQLNRDAVLAWVNAQAANLTNHNYIKALIDPDPKTSPSSSVMRGIEQASEGLMRPWTLSASNPPFRQAYAQALIKTLPELLNNHLIPRTEAMIVLGTIGDPDALPIYQAQLKDRNQVMMVKLWAARGVTNTTQNGRRELDPGKANAAAGALVDFLKNDQDATWPAQWRALEALGCLRLSGDVNDPGRVEMASTALKFLADPKTDLKVRGMASWALGMMRVPAQVGKFNFALVAYHIGQLVAELGERIDTNFTSNPEDAHKYTGMLLFQAMAGLRGVDGIRDSGIANSPNLGNSKKNVGEILDRAQAIAVSAYNLTSTATPKLQRPQRQKELASRVARLKDYLAKNKPESWSLVPGGPEFAGPAAQVAEGGPSK